MKSIKINAEKSICFVGGALLSFLILCFFTFPALNEFKAAETQQTQIENFEKSNHTQSEQEYLTDFFQGHEVATKVTDPFVSLNKKARVKAEKEMQQPKTVGEFIVPKKKIVIPIYKTITPTVDKYGVGLLASSGPVIGGQGTHAVIVGDHSLRKMRAKVNDTFAIKVNNDLHTYKVEKIAKVSPDSINKNSFPTDNAKDQMTLVTKNLLGNKRILIQATRVPTDQKIVIATTSKWIYLVQAFLSVVILFVILILGFSICTKISVKKMIANRR